MIDNENRLVSRVEEVFNVWDYVLFGIMLGKGFKMVLVNRFLICRSLIGFANLLSADWSELEHVSET